MMVDRDVAIEYGGEAEAGASIGSRTASRLPNFTDEALEKGLGSKVNRQIEKALENLVRAKEESARDKVEAGDLAGPEPEPEGIGLPDVD